MKKIYLYLLLLSVFMVSCQKEEILPPEDIQEHSKMSVEEVSFGALPSHIQNLFYDKSNSNLKTSEKGSSHFGPPRTDIPALKNKNKMGKISYTIALKKLPGVSLENPYFDNIVIDSLSNNTQKVRVLRYEPLLKWYNSPNRNTDLYSGKITFYSYRGELLGKIFLRDGEEYEEKQQLKAWTTTCSYEMVGWQCTGTFDGNESCSYTFEEQCTSTYDRTMDDGSDTSGGGYTEDPTEPSGSGTMTTPIPGEEVKIENNLTDPCAKDIFSNLRTGPLVDDPLKPEVEISKDEIYNLTTEILDLFNNHRTVNYIVGNDNGGNRTYPSYGQVYTFLNNSYLNSATSLSIARTLIHESLHAYLLVENSNPQSSLYGSLNEYAKAHGYTDANDIHHNFMESYINAMTYSLYKWDSIYGTGGLKDSMGEIDTKYYKAMAFGGFYKFDRYGNRIDYDSFKALVPDKNDRDKIVAIIKNEQDGNGDSRGKDC